MEPEIRLVMKMGEAASGCLLLQRFFGRIDELFKCNRIIDCNLGKLLAVEFDASKRNTLYKAAVVDAVGAHCSVDAHDPELTKFALLFAAIPVGKFFGAFNGVFGVAVKA